MLLTSSSHFVLSREYKTSSLQKFHAVMASGSLVSSAGLCNGASRSALWLPLDLVLEDAMDGYQVDATSAVENITGKHSFLSFLLQIVFQITIRLKRKKKSMSVRLRGFICRSD